MTSRRGRLLDGVLLSCLVACVLGVTWAYVSAEQWIHFWDHAHYHQIARDVTAACTVSLHAGWEAVRASFARDYNALFALPLVPILAGLGTSRLVYELALALVYLVPLVLAIAWLAAQLATGRARLAFWSAAACALATPMLWVPTLRGFPDSSSAALFVVAVGLRLRDIDRPRARTWLAIGMLLAVAVLLRRHFAYAVSAFSMAECVCLLRDTAGPGRAAERLHRLAVGLGRLTLAAAVGAATALLISRDYVERMLAFDYRTLYASYEVGLPALAAWYGAPYGWFVWIAAVAGLLVGASQDGPQRPRVRFLLLLAAFTIVQWCALVRQVGEQYTLHITPALVTGCWLLLWRAWTATRVVRTPAVILSVLAGSANLVLGLSFWNPMPEATARSLFAAQWSPLVRHDLPEMERLVKVLESRRRHDEDAVFVAASSHVLNPDLIRQTAIRLGRGRQAIEVLRVPQIDSQDVLPLGRLLSARWVVVARPFQHHVQREEQQVVLAVHEAFTRGWPMAADFSLLPGTFQFGNCTARVYERRHPTPLATSLATLVEMQRLVGSRAGMQPDWVVVERRFPSWLRRHHDGSSEWVAHPAPHGSFPGTVAASLEPVSGHVGVSGVVTFLDRRCVGLTLALSRLGADGRLDHLASVQRRPGEEGRFRLAAEADRTERVFLSLLDHSPGASIDYCLARIDPLVLLTPPGQNAAADTR